METIFTISDLNLRYDQNQVLHSINLNIKIKLPPL